MTQLRQAHPRTDLLSGQVLWQAGKSLGIGGYIPWGQRACPTPARYRACSWGSIPASFVRISTEFSPCCEFDRQSHIGYNSPSRWDCKERVLNWEWTREIQVSWLYRKLLFGHGWIRIIRMGERKWLSVFICENLRPIKFMKQGKIGFRLDHLPRNWSRIPGNRSLRLLVLKTLSRNGKEQILPSLRLSPPFRVTTEVGFGLHFIWQKHSSFANIPIEFSP